MGRRLPHVVSPIAQLFEREGVQIVLVSVELWADGVVLRFGSLPSDLTARLEADWDEAFEEWATKRVAGIAPERAPQTASEALLQFEPELTDDVGTAYERRSGQLGGGINGRAIRGEWFFEPRVPDRASELRIRTSFDDHETRVRVALAGSPHDEARAGDERLELRVRHVARQVLHPAVGRGDDPLERYVLSARRIRSATVSATRPRSCPGRARRR